MGRWFLGNHESGVVILGEFFAVMQARQPTARSRMSTIPPACLRHHFSKGGFGDCGHAASGVNERRLRAALACRGERDG